MIDTARSARRARSARPAASADALVHARAIANESVADGDDYDLDDAGEQRTLERPEHLLVWFGHAPIVDPSNGQGPRRKSSRTIVDATSRHPQRLET